MSTKPLGRKNKFVRYESLQQIEADWKDCTRCPLGLTARHHVIYETLMTAPPSKPMYGILCNKVDLMIVGEAPGIGEDVLGRPFIGTSGKLLRQCLSNALSQHYSVSICLANCVCCRPFEEVPSSSKNRAPELLELELCLPHLVGLIDVLKPRLIIAAGAIAEVFVPQAIEKSIAEPKLGLIRHPAWLIRQSDQVFAQEIYVDSIRKELLKIK